MTGAFPYLPLHGRGHCDLCGAPANKLATVVLRPAGRQLDALGREVYRAARVALVCRRHRGELAQGAPIVPPNMRMAPGTSGRRPQAEALFDDLAFKRAARR